MTAIKRKSTEELMNEILSGQQVQEYVAENKEELREMSLANWLQACLQRHELKRAELFRRAGLVGSNYGYELFQSDRKKPSRDVVLLICLAFPLTVEETQQTLRNAGLAILYPRDLRDAYLLYALKNQWSIDSVNAMLTEKGLEPLWKNGETR